MPIPITLQPLRGDSGTAAHTAAEDRRERSERLQGMRNGTIAMVHSWELVTAVDGPGTRMTIFLAGCPLRCQYCHNPDTMLMRNGKATGIDEIWARIEKYRPIFRATGGGITLSGGEVLMQPAFATELFRRAKAAGIHTTLDTSGFLGGSASDELLELTDLVLLDIKSGDPQIYREVTGRELEPTLVFAQRLADRGVPIWVRYVLVPTLTDSPASYEPVAEFAATIPTVERVEVLPFHQMGQSKWEELRMNYTLDGVQPPDQELLDRVRSAFSRHRLRTF